MEKLMWLYAISVQLVILQSAIVPSFSVHHLCHHDEGLALLQLKEQFKINPSLTVFSFECAWLDRQIPYPKIASWNESTDCCTWDGVTCRKSDGHIIGLDLSCSQIEGVISPNSSLFGLSQLQRLNLAQNDFQNSQVSHQFSRLAQLTHLNLSNSNFNGQIASEISHLSELVLLDLSQYFSPTRFEKHDFQMLLQNLTKISVLCLSSVEIPFEIPRNLSSSLTYLDLSSTGIHGELPNHVFEIPNMRRLVLNQNQNLSGSLPKFNCSTCSLEFLDVSGTRVSGELPDSIGSLKSLNFLDLHDCQFSGSIPESIGNLSKLAFLHLNYNYFTGQIPRSISNLVRLESLYLDSNRLQGPIPDSFSNLQELTFLSLSSNPNLVSQLPPSIANLTNLQGLEIMFSSLTGPLPSNMSGFQRLTSLQLTYNMLNGTIPAWLFLLPTLIYLDLGYNHFTGQLPNFTGNSSLAYVFLDHNNLQGPVPMSFSTLLNPLLLNLSSNNLSGIVDSMTFSNMKNLGSLDLSSNRLVWNDVNMSFPKLEYLVLSSSGLNEIPSFVQNSKNLTYLDLSNNNIHQIPSWLTSMAWNSLSYLNLSCNALSAPFILPWKSITILDIQSNQLEGPLPISMCNLKVLFILDMSDNKFSGEIAHCFGNFSSRLAVLNLKNNHLQGSIAMTFTPNNSLRYLGLQGNLLEGPLPRSLVNCDQLEVFDVGNNRISDTFPTWVENLKELQVLVLKSNQFFGPIDIDFDTKGSFKKLRIMDLSNNKFTGIVPARLLTSLIGMMNSGRNESKALYMGALNSSYVYLSIPSTYSLSIYAQWLQIGLPESVTNYRYSLSISTKGLSMELPQIITTLTVIDLSGNRFHGEIDEVIGNLVGLKALNLSHNRFSGHIPSSFGNLSSLESLDISCNQIDGEIPWRLTMITSLEFLNLSHNHLVGRIPQGKQFDTFSNDSYKGNLGLCGRPLTKNCGESDSEVPPPLPADQEQEESDFFNGFTWKPVIIGYGFGIVLGMALGSLMFATGKPQRIVRFIEEEIYQCSILLFRRRRVSKRFSKSNKRSQRLRRRTH